MDMIPTNQTDPAAIEILDTNRLIGIYPQYFTLTKTDIRDLYVENALPESKFRSYRYVASITKTVEPRLPIQDLVKLYSEDIWGKTLAKGDLEEIQKATTLIKIAMDSNDADRDPHASERNITLSDGSSINVEYVPYSKDKTGEILGDMNQHLDIAE